MDTRPGDATAAGKIIQVLDEKIVFNSRPLTLFDK